MSSGRNVLRLRIAVGKDEIQNLMNLAYAEFIK